MPNQRQIAVDPLGFWQACPLGQLFGKLLLQQNITGLAFAHEPFTHDNPGVQSHAVVHG
jgi:hypothetical protein